DLPLAAYNVSGEYSMLKFAVKEGLLNEDVILESITSIKRAGAVMSIGIFLQIKYRVVARRLSIKYSKLWVGAEILLFVLVGAT
ncbi:hypothetical protein ACTPD5_22730, partial [Clostridioides difficile]